MELLKRNIEFIVSQQYSSVVHFARAGCLGGNVLNGREQKPFNGVIPYDYILWIDSDIVFRPEDVLTLLESPHDVTGGLYMMEDQTHFPVVKTWDTEFFAKNGSFEFMTQDAIKAVKGGGTRYMECEYMGMGFMLVKYGAIEKLTYPWFYREVQEITTIDGKVVCDMPSEDVAFCKNLKAAGVKLMVDINVRVGHEKNLVI